MKKIKLLFIFLLVTAFSCSSYTFIPELSAIKIETLKRTTDLQYQIRLISDNKTNIYFKDNNQIKKIDENNKVSILVGKEKPDEYPEDEVIDGDLNSAKFGVIEYIQYVELEKEFYFMNSFSREKIVELEDIYGSQVLLPFKEKYGREKKKVYDYYCFIRKVTKDNEVKTVLKLGCNSYIHINNNGIALIKNYSEPTKIKIKNLNNTNVEKKFSSPSFNDSTTYLMLDSEESIYLIKNGNSVYKFVNNNFINVFSTNTTKSILLDENDNLYIIEDPRLYNSAHEQISGLNEPILIHKIPKEDTKKTSISKDIISKKYLVGTLPKDYNAISVNNKTKTLLLEHLDSVFKIKFEK